mgnify:CR=1 FL=1
MAQGVGRRARASKHIVGIVDEAQTSGVLLLAKKRSALTHVQDQFRSRDTGKIYAALVLGHWPAKLKVIDVALHKTLDARGERHVLPVAADHPDGRRSISLVQVVTNFQDCTLLDVTLKTGRTHQIRVHLQHEGHPIVGDDKYGDFALNKALGRGSVNEPIKGLDRRQLPEGRFARMFLHARYLRIDHPVTGEPLTLEAPLPADCAQLLTALAPLDPASAKA